jgi:putative PIN family toxin of toxin-antitoxin system
MSVPRAVLDTNILVSGILGGAGLPVLKQWRKGNLILVMSHEIYAEYRAVLRRPRFGLPGRLVDELLDFIREQADWVEPEIQVSIVRDPSDDKFIEAAICGHANAIISADRDLLDLGEVEGIPIVPPWEFAE